MGQKTPTAKTSSHRRPEPRGGRDVSARRPRRPQSRPGRGDHGPTKGPEPQVQKETPVAAPALLVQSRQPRPHPPRRPPPPRRPRRYRSHRPSPTAEPEQASAPPPLRQPQVPETPPPETGQSPRSSMGLVVREEAFVRLRGGAGTTTPTTPRARPRAFGFPSPTDYISRQPSRLSRPPSRDTSRTGRQVGERVGFPLAAATAPRSDSPASPAAPAAGAASPTLLGRGAAGPGAQSPGRNTPNPSSPPAGATPPGSALVLRCRRSPQP